MLNTCAFAFSLAVTLTVWPSCYGDNAATIALPNPADDDRPPGSPAELPRVAVELPAGPPGPASLIVREGGDLQSAIDQAKPGDTIALQPGAVFRGSLTLPKKNGDGWITLRTDAMDSDFPPSGTRVTPADARLMPVIETDNDGAIRADAGAHHYRFIGIEIRPKPGLFIYNLILLGLEARSVQELPHHIVFERCYIHGDSNVGGRRGIALNAAHTAVLDSYLSDFKEHGNDSQAIAGWNGTGPFEIGNTYLEAAGENLMFGGADPTIPNLVPSDIVVRDNFFSKPTAWRSSPWSVKNLFELKNARRVLIERNVFENNWPNAQNGYAILLTPRNQDGNSPWSMVRDVTFQMNLVRHVSSGMNILGADDINPSQQTKRICIRNNVFDDVSNVHWGGVGNLIQMLNGAADVTVEHNTAFETSGILVASGPPNLGFAFTNNLVANGAYGVAGDSHYGDPQGALSAYFPGSSFVGNVLQGAKPSHYPAGNFFPASLSDIGFVDFAGGDYRLQAGSPYKNAGTDGKDIGADLNSSAAPPARRRAIRSSNSNSDSSGK